MKLLQLFMWSLKRFWTMFYWETIFFIVYFVFKCVQRVLKIYSIMTYFAKSSCYMLSTIISRIRSRTMLPLLLNFLQRIARRSTTLILIKSFSSSTLKESRTSAKLFVSLLMWLRMRRQSKIIVIYRSYCL